jgi:hypothetical protein
MSVLIVSMLLVASEPSVQVETLSGETFTGSLARITAAEVGLQTAEGPVTIQAARLKELVVSKPSSSDAGEPAVQVELVDGSTLPATEYTAEEGRASVTRASGDAVPIPASDVASVRLQPENPATRAEWSRILDSEPDTDLLVVRKAGALDYHGGLIKNVTATVVEFEIDGEVLPVKRSKVFGLVYYQSAGRSLPDPVCFVTESTGSRWAARAVQLEGDTLKWTARVGVEVAAPLSSVERIDFSQGKILCLSDLEPESVQWRPYFDMGDRLELVAPLFTLREDRSFGTGPLQVEGKQYAKGLALHSRTEAVYRLPGRFRRFQATVGIDDEVRPHGSVVLVIRGDDAVLLEKPINGTDPPLPVDLDIQGVRRLTILVDFGADLDVSDHLDLCEASVVK